MSSGRRIGLGRISVPDVEPGGFDGSVFQSFIERFFIHHFGSPHIDQDGIRRKKGQLFGSDDVFGFLGERQAKKQDLGPWEQGSEVGYRLNVTSFAPIDGGGVKAEGATYLSNTLADMTVPYDRVVICVSPTAAICRLCGGDLRKKRYSQFCLKVQ